MNIEFDWEFTASILPALFKAFGMTLLITGAGFCIAVVAGLVFALLRRSGTRGVSWTAVGIVEFLRSTPLLVQLYFLYFVLPEFGLTVSAFTVGTVGIGLHYSAYMSEVYRAGIEGVPRTQWESAVALNLGPFRTYRDVILPQAIPPILPATGNYLVAMLKDTPILSAITVVEVLQKAKIMGSENFLYLEPFTLVGIMFLLVTLVAGRGLATLERLVPQRGIPLR